MRNLSLPPHSRSLFDQLLQATRQKDLSRGQALHAQILKTTAASSCSVLNSGLVNFYAKCGALPQALRHFQAIPDKDVVSWNSLINGFSQHGGLSGASYAILLFKRMRSAHGVAAFPNAHTFAGVFTAASTLADVSAGQQAHALSIKGAGFRDVFVGSSALNMYCKAGFISDARRLFDRMPVRNSVSWATVISGYAMQELSVEALELFVLLQRYEEEENEYVLTSVLSALTAREFVEQGRQIHGLVVKNGLLSFISVGNALVTMYAKCEALDDALRMFETSSDKNSITWSAMVTGYAQGGNSLEALRLFTNMHFSGVMPSEFTIVGVINASSDAGAVKVGRQVHDYSVKLGYESQVFIMTALVDMYAKCGSISDARKGFDFLQEPDIVLWTSMIGGYVQNGENEDALSLYSRMEMEGICPNELTLTSVIKACSSLTALEQGKQVHACTIKYGFGLAVPIGSSLSTLYAKCGSLEDGNAAFRRMPTRDVVSWNAMISGLSQNGHGKEALELFEEMRLEGSKPDYVTFVNILSACSHMGLVERGWTYFKMMSNEFGLHPQVEHYACMVDILSRAGKLNEAKEFIESADVDHGMCLWRILLGACRNYRYYDLGVYAGEKLMELGSQESSAYVLLSSIYSSMGRGEDVERVWRTMKIRGVSKEPGCSWIEHKSRVHVFVVHDELHPEIKDIRYELRKLYKQMKDEGYRPSINCF